MRSRALGTLGAALLAGLASCAAFGEPMPLLARARAAEDFESYRITRVGIMPFQGDALEADTARARELQAAFQAELARTTPFELVLLDPTDLEEVKGSEPHRRGWYRPATIIETSRRFDLDAVAFGTLVTERLFPPQELAVQVDLVAAETGLVIWSAAIHLVGSDPAVRRGLELYYGKGAAIDAPWELALVSPTRFARFAAFQIAQLL